MPPSTEARHPIGVVSERTGLTPDVLRVWERRYGVVEPERSPGGQRVYSDADIERLILLHRATRDGHGIGQVARLSKARLEALVRDVELQSASAARFVRPGDPDDTVAQALTFAEALDAASLEALLRRSVARYGITVFIDSVAAPFLRRVGDMWHAGKLTPSQEHLSTAVVERVVSETAPLLSGGPGNSVIVIATLEGERHANGALMAAATAASEGWGVIYLGPDLPVEEIAHAALRTGARAVGVSAVVFDRRRVKLLAALEKALPPGVALLVGGSASKEIRHEAGRSRAVFVESMAGLRAELEVIAKR